MYVMFFYELEALIKHFWVGRHGLFFAILVLKLNISLLFVWFYFLLSLQSYQLKPKPIFDPVKLKLKYFIETLHLCHIYKSYIMKESSP